MRMKKRTVFYLSVLCIFLIPVVAGAQPYGILMKRGNRYFKRGLYRDALGYYLKGSEKNKRALEPYFNSADAYYKVEDYSASIEELTKALQKTDKPDSLADIHYNLGNSYFKLGDYNKAAENYKKGLEYNPGDLNMKYNLELTLKKMSENKPSDNENNNNNKNAGTQGKNQSPDQKENQSNQPEKAQQKQPPQEQKEFTPEEARRLVNSTNTDQSKTLAEIIRKKAGSVQNDEDW